MAAVGHGADVVILLYGILLAKERSHDDTRTWYRVGYTAGLLLQFVVGIVRADVHPVLVALVR